MTRKGRATPAPSQSATATASTVVGNNGEKTRLHMSICTTWGIQGIHKILQSELRKRFKQTAESSLDGISVDVLRALNELARLASTTKLRKTVEEEMERMWERRLHIREPKKIGGNPKEWNEKFLHDIKRLTRDVKRSLGMPMGCTSEDG